MKSSYLQDVGFRFFKDCDKLVFKYVYSNHQSPSHEHLVYYVPIKDDRMQITGANLPYGQRNLSSANFYEIIPKVAESAELPFLYLSFDNAFKSFLETNCKEDETNDASSLVIVSDPFDAMAIHQQTKLPVLVLKFFNNSSKSLELKNLLRKVNEFYDKVSFSVF